MLNAWYWVKIPADDILKYFFQEIGFDVSCKLNLHINCLLMSKPVLGDNLCEMAKPFFWKK